MLRGELNSIGNLRGDLTGGIFYGTNDYEDLINKPQVNGVTLSGNKTTTDLGIIIPDKVSDLDNDLNFVEASDLATVATTGSYNDLIDTPTIPAQVQSNWNESDTTSPAYIQNKPAIPTNTSDLINDSGFVNTGMLATVAISGSYNDLLNQPLIPTTTSDLVNDSGFVTSSDLATVATTGDYDDLINKPTIPAAQVQSDWSQADNTQVDYIKNKPTIPANLSDLNNDEGFIGFTDLTDTLTAGNTTLTISDASITTTSTIDIYTDVFGIQPTNASVATGSITLTFLAQASDITVKVRVS